MSPAAFNEHLAGEARAILAKAEVVARVAGVPYDSAIMTSDRPHEAILHVAESRGCDLIFIASHGRRGIKGLDARLADAESAPADDDSGAGVGGRKQSAVRPRCSRRSRRSATSTARSPRSSTGSNSSPAQARDHGTTPSFPLLRAMLHYLVAFPEKLHHPKEDAYLFRKLRARTQRVRRDARRTRTPARRGTRARRRSWHGASTPTRRIPSGGLTRFAAAVERFSTSQMQHMALEAKVDHPRRARTHLTAEDWAEIGAAFASNGDPRFSVDNDEEFRQLFARIINLAQAQVALRTARRLNQRSAHSNHSLHQGDRRSCNIHR